VSGSEKGQEQWQTNTPSPQGFPPVFPAPLRLSVCLGPVFTLIYVENGWNRRASHL